MDSGRALLGIWRGSTKIGLVVGERTALDFWGDPLSFAVPIYGVVHQSVGGKTVPCSSFRT